jgi:hypothetical protein
MGAWGMGNFENDEACDYADNVAHGGGIALLEKTLDRVLAEGAAYLETPDGTEALAAGDIVARLLGHVEDETGLEALDAWIAATIAKPSRELVDKAKRAAQRVLSEPSELMELWQDSDHFEVWRATVESLIQRLRS